MDFYQSISRYYQHIFPLNRMQVRFIESSHVDKTCQSVLDIGCAIRDLSQELASRGHQVVGIDLDEGMLKKAKNRKGNSCGKPSFLKLNMLELDQVFTSNTFDTIACFGNTLVHLESANSILNFFEQAGKVLKEDGKFLLQIINYDRILDAGINCLPTIENDVIRFERNYIYNPDRHAINFETILTSKEDRNQIKNCIELYPIRQKEIDQLLRIAGFSCINYYSNFKRNPIGPDCLPLVVEAAK
jgi:SAM-dependent methyltransferase